MLLLWRHKLRDCCEKEGDPWKVFLLPPPILRAWVGVLGVTETTVHPLENLQTSQVQHKMQDLFVWSLFLFPRFSEEEPVFSFVLCGRDGGWVCWQIPYIARTSLSCGYFWVCLKSVIAADVVIELSFDKNCWKKYRHPTNRKRYVTTPSVPV